MFSGNPTWVLCKEHQWLLTAEPFLCLFGWLVLVFWFLWEVFCFLFLFCFVFCLRQGLDVHHISKSCPLMSPSLVSTVTFPSSGPSEPKWCHRSHLDQTKQWSRNFSVKKKFSFPPLVSWRKPPHLPEPQIFQTGKKVLTAAMAAGNRVLSVYSNHYLVGPCPLQQRQAKK